MPIIFATCDKRLPTFVTFERSVFYHLNPEPTRRSGRTHGHGTPGHVMGVWVDLYLLVWKIWLFARTGIGKISIFKNIYLENRLIQ